MVRNAMQDEVQRGWQLIIPLDSVTHIKGAIMSPLGIVEQETIDEHGKYKTKHRITHDQSFNPIPETKRSVNDRVIHHVLTPCNYGRALLRYITRIVELRTVQPTTHIFQTKVDWKAAYR